MKESLITRIKKYLSEVKVEVNLDTLYSVFADQKPTTIRGRINENIGKDILRVGKGLYISTQAIVENANIMERIDDMIAAEMKYDFVFLDIPYKSAGQMGGNRDIAKFETISPAQFEELLSKLRHVLGTHGTIQFMITSGKSSMRQVDKYKECFEKTGYFLLGAGGYTKMNKNGSRCNIGKYLLPPEDIMVYGLDPEINVAEWTFDFEDVRPIGYPTEKPVSLMRNLIRQATQIGDWVLDPFGGSGATLQACLELRRKCHILDISMDAVENFIAPRLYRDVAV